MQGTNTTDLDRIERDVLAIVDEFAPGERELAEMYWHDMRRGAGGGDGPRGDKFLGFGIELDASTILSQVIVGVAVSIAREQATASAKMIYVLLKERISAINIKLDDDTIGKMAERLRAVFK